MERLALVIVKPETVIGWHRQESDLEKQPGSLR
jgi:hypothetical protein